MKVKSIYVCEICDTQHITKKKAENCETKCKAVKAIKEQDKAVQKQEEDKHFAAKSVAEIAEHISDYLTKNTKIECRAVFRVNPYELCSNSHDAPKGKRTNWCKNSELPTGYMGMSGSLDIYIEGGYDSSVSKYFDYYRNKYNISTGSGGCMPHGLGWSVTIWADDYPNIKKQMEEYFILKDKYAKYENELEDIEYKYHRDKSNFISNHEKYINQLRILDEAQKNLDKIVESLHEEFESISPIYQPTAEQISLNDISTAKNKFIE